MSDGAGRLMYLAYDPERGGYIRGYALGLVQASDDKLLACKHRSGEYAVIYESGGHYNGGMLNPRAWMEARYYVVLPTGVMRDGFTEYRVLHTEYSGRGLARQAVKRCAEFIERAALESDAD